MPSRTPTPRPVALVRGERAKAAGKGFLIAPDGYLVTNSHVASGATRVEFTPTDECSASAARVGAAAAMTAAAPAFAARA